MSLRSSGLRSLPRPPPLLQHPVPDLLHRFEPSRGFPRERDNCLAAVIVARDDAVADQAQCFGVVDGVGQRYFDFEDERERLAALRLTRARAPVTCTADTRHGMAPSIRYE